MAKGKQHYENLLFCPISKQQQEHVKESRGHKFGSYKMVSYDREVQEILKHYPR